MGAVLAVDELMALAGGDDALVAEYGAQAGPALAAASAVPTSSSAATPYAGDAVVIKDGTIHLVEVGETIRDGAVLVEDGKIVAIGPADTIDVPGGASVVDHGPDAVIVPGLVAVDSNYTQQAAGPRTADPTLLAIDQFDPYTPIVSALRSGITTVYLPPARGRLIAGQGAVVKTGGGSAVSADGRVLKERSGIHGSISSEARRTPGYWEPPVPATVDVGLGVPKPQLPTTTMGAASVSRSRSCPPPPWAPSSRSMSSWLWPGATTLWSPSTGPRRARRSPRP